MIYDFGNGAVTSDEQTEALAHEQYEGRQQPCRALTEVFAHQEQLFVRLSNVNGPLITWRVVAVEYEIFLQELEHEEVEELATVS